MSVSIQSETSKDEIETEDAELEDLVWNLMSRDGILSQIQGQISKFIEENGKVDSGTCIIPERADGKILGFIFEYLQWVGMKQTNSVLLSESPVEVDMSTYESRNEGPDYKPEIYRLLDEQNITDGKASPSRSHNYSRDEFEDSRFTSGSGHQSIKSDNLIEDEASHNGNESEEEESYSSHKQAGQKSFSREEEKKNAVEQPNVTLDIKTTVPAAAVVNPITELLEEDTNKDMISFNSPAPMPRGFDQIRPNVTLRQRFDQMSDPFQSPTATAVSLDAVPVVDSHNTLNFVQTSNSLEEILGDDRLAAEAHTVSKVLADDNDSSTSKKLSKSENKVEDINFTRQEMGKDSQGPIEQRDLKEPPSASQDEDESTSDFMDMLTMEDDTQDASIASDEKGMSSCEHAFSLK